MTPVLPDFERRVRDALAAEPVVLPPLEDLITDGCANALQLETELARLERRRERLLTLAGVQDEAAHDALDVAARMEEVEHDLDVVRGLVGELMSLRARTRLRSFLAEARP
jgi:hypothetical protein